MATVVQSTNGVADCGNPSSSVAFGSNVTSGNKLIVAVTFDAGTAAAAGSISDTQGNTYTRDAFISTSPSSAIYSTTAGSSGANTVTVTNGSCKGICLYEVNGLGAFDAGNSSSGNSTTPSSGSISAAGAGFIVTVVGIELSTSITGPGGSWSQHGFENEAYSTMPINSQYQLNGAGGSFSTSWTTGGAAAWSAAIAAYANSGGGGGGGNTVTWAGFIG